MNSEGLALVPSSFHEHAHLLEPQSILTGPQPSLTMAPQVALINRPTLDDDLTPKTLNLDHLAIATALPDPVVDNNPGDWTDKPYQWEQAGGVNIEASLNLHGSDRSANTETGLANVAQATPKTAGNNLPGTLTTSWFGNTWSGQVKERGPKSDSILIPNGRWAGKDIDDIATFKSGKFHNVIATIGLQEEDRSLRLYKEVNGQPELHWKLFLNGLNGGYGITGDRNSLYFLARKPKRRTSQSPDRQQFHYLFRVDLDQLQNAINRRFPANPFQPNRYNFSRLNSAIDATTGTPLEGNSGNVLYNGKDVGQFIKIDTTAEDPLSDFPAGITVKGNTVFVSNPQRNKIQIFDRISLSERKARSFRTKREPRRLVIDEDRNLWVIERDRSRLNQNREYVINGYGIRRGQYQKFKTIFFQNTEYRDWKLTDIEYVNKRLLVTDSEHHQVLRINPTRNQVKPTVVIGRLNGNWNPLNSSNPGIKNQAQVSRSNANLYFPSGIATDASGNNLLVASNGVGHLEFDPRNTADVFSSVFLGSTLQKFNHRQSKWAVEGLEFTEISDGDPLNPNRVYTQDSRYRIFPNVQPQEGNRHSHWKHVAWTASPFNSTSDSRFTVRRNYETRLFRIPRKASQPNQTNLFLTTWGDQSFSLFRFKDNNKTAIPTMILGYGGGDITQDLTLWPFTKVNGKGSNNRKATDPSLWMWLDGSNGSKADGQFQAREFSKIPQKISWNAFNRISVSDDGSIWINANNEILGEGDERQVQDGKVYHFFLDPNNLTKRGVPQYQKTNINSYRFDDGSRLTDVKGVVYEAKTNNLYLSTENRNRRSLDGRSTSGDVIEYRNFFGQGRNQWFNKTVVSSQYLQKQDGKNSTVINGFRHFNVKLQNSNKLLSSRRKTQFLPFFGDRRSNNNRRSSPHTIEVEGRYIFVAYNLREVPASRISSELQNQGFEPGQDSLIAVYDRTKPADNRFVGTIQPGPVVGNYNTQVDLYSAPNVREKDGLYTIFMEGYLHNLGFYYQWKPQR